MRMKALIIGAVLCASAAGVYVSLGDVATDPEAVLAGVMGGQLPRDCVYVRFPDPWDTCADDIYTGACYFIGPHYLDCTYPAWYTNCTQEPKYCRERDDYSGDCTDSWTDCEGIWSVYLCTGVAPFLCDWEFLGTYLCSEHPHWPIKPWCYES